MASSDEAFISGAFAGNSVGGDMEVKDRTETVTRCVKRCQESPSFGCAKASSRLETQCRHSWRNLREREREQDLKDVDVVQHELDLHLQLNSFVDDGGFALKRADLTVQQFGPFRHSLVVEMACGYKREISFL